jgi:hypothetical protein
MMTQEEALNYKLMSEEFVKLHERHKLANEHIRNLEREIERLKAQMARRERERLTG